MKKICLVTSIILLITVIRFINPITDFLVQKISKTPTLVLASSNEYTKDEDYLFVQRAKSFVPYSYQDIINIIYSTINNGWDTFTFYCPSEYQECLNDVKKISKDKLIFTHINNYVHPFNSFTEASTVIGKSGEITINVKFLYTPEEIKKINEAVDKVIKENIPNDMEDYDKIKTIHDYIINNTKYDIERNESNNSKYNSYTAYGPIIDGIATCSGYTDLMAIFLTKLGFNNYKIATTPDLIKDSKTGHVWNAVYYNNEWVHLDLTWDDPVSNDGKDYLFHTYFLVNNEAMEEADKGGETVIEEHNFNKLYYLEFK